MRIRNDPEQTERNMPDTGCRCPRGIADDAKSLLAVGPVIVLSYKNYKRITAARLCEAEDPAALFREPADGYGGDPDRAEAPNGYVCARGTVNGEEREAAAG